MWAATLGKAVRDGDRTWRPRATLPLPHSGEAANMSEAWATPGGLCLVCADAHVVAGKWKTQLLVQFLPLMLPALSQLSVFRSHELSRLGTSCNLAETSKENPDVAGNAVRLGQPRTNSVLVGATAWLASSFPNRKLLLISWWLVATRTTTISHALMLKSESHWPSPVLTYLIFCCNLNQRSFVDFLLSRQWLCNTSGWG